MTSAARSIHLFGIYMMFAGVSSVLFPDAPLKLVGLPAARDHWLQSAAVIIAILGYYYTVAARHEMTPFFRATVIGRVLVLIWNVTLVARGIAPPQLLLLNVLDVLGASWTWSALRKRAR